MTVLCVRPLPGVLWFWICLAVDCFCDLTAPERKDPAHGGYVQGNDRMKTVR